MNGNVLKDLRLNKKLTQKELGDLIGVSGSTIRMMEKNQRNGSLEVVSKLADYFNVSIDYLEGRTTLKNSTEIAHTIVNKLIDLKIIDDVNQINNDVINVIHEYVNKKDTYK